MKKLRKLFNILLIIFFYVTKISANSIDKNDTDFLKNTDKNLFFKKCFYSGNFLESGKCLNFLGIKIFLYTLDENNFNKEQFSKIQKKSINYLITASNRGYKKAFINLGWIYSLETTTFYNLEKSAYFFNKAYLKDVDVKKDEIKTEKKVNRDKYISDYEYLELAVSLMKTLELYNTVKKDNKSFYIKNTDLDIARQYFKKIMKKNNLSNDKLERIELNVEKKNKIIFDLLKKDLNNYKNKYKIDAEKKLKKIISIYYKLL